MSYALDTVCILAFATDGHLANFLLVSHIVWLSERLTDWSDVVHLMVAHSLCLAHVLSLCARSLAHMALLPRPCAQEGGDEL